MKLDRKSLRRLIESVIHESSDQQVAPTVKNTTNSVGKQKTWKKLTSKTKTEGHHYFLARTSFGGGKGITLASEHPFTVVDSKGKEHAAVEKEIIGYWKGSLPAYIFNGKLNAEDIAVVSIDSDKLIDHITESKGEVFSIVSPY